MNSPIESIVEDFGHVTNPDCVAVLERLKELDLPIFEVAEQIVKDRMLAERENLKSKYGGEPYISFSLAFGKPGWKVYPVGITDMVSRGNGFTLTECLSDLPPVKSPEQIKAERISELEAELARLKNE